APRASRARCRCARLPPAQGHSQRDPAPGARRQRLVLALRSERNHAVRELAAARCHAGACTATDPAGTGGSAGGSARFGGPASRRAPAELRDDGRPPDGHIDASPLSLQPAGHRAAALQSGQYATRLGCRAAGDRDAGPPHHADAGGRSGT
ncbi:hypothetical protein QU38_01810, partial [Staphylococcus aureus]